MPKMKTKSSAKKRFKLTASGKVKYQPAFKRHNLTAKTQGMKRKARHGRVLFEADAEKVIRFYLPNGL